MQTYVNTYYKNRDHVISDHNNRSIQRAVDADVNVEGHR